MICSSLGYRLGLAVAFLAAAVPLVAQPPAASPPSDVRPAQEANRDLFLRFQRELLTLAQRLETSDKPQDKERAKVVRSALELMQREQVGGQFQKMLDRMRNGVQPAELDLLAGQDTQLTKALNDVLQLLLTDDADARAKQERERLEKLLAEARDILRQQKTIRAMTEATTTDPKRIAKDQAEAKARTQDLAKRMGGEPKSKDAAPKYGKPKDGQPKDGQPKDGQPKDGAPKAGQPKDGQPQAKSPPPPPTPGRKQIQEAVPHQQQAEDELNKADRQQAAKAEEKAVRALEEAVKELEKKLKQLREEEAQKLLANLETRVARMLQMQTEVYESTKVIDAGIARANGVKSTADVQKSQQLADRELEIVAEADKTLKLLASEGTAVAFALILEEVHVDMQQIQRRLNESFVGRDTQAIEENVIAMLKEMLAAVKKAQQDQKQAQQGQADGQAAKPQDQALIDALAELRLIRALQTHVNSRTKLQAARYDGEQASDPLIQAELRELAARQAKLQDMIEKLWKGENR